jgi:hypothetical protein
MNKQPKPHLKQHKGLWQAELKVGRIKVISKPAKTPKRAYMALMEGLHNAI